MPIFCPFTGSYWHLVMSTGAIHGRSESDLLLPCDDQTALGEPMAKSRQPRSLSAKRNENYSSSVQILPGDANRGSIGRGYSILKGGLQYSYIRKYQTLSVSALTVCCSRPHISRAGPLFGSISRDNNSLTITGKSVPRH